MDNDEQNGQNSQPENQPPTHHELVGPDYWKKPKRSKLLYLVALLIVAAALVAGYWFLLKPKSAKTTQQTQAITTKPDVISSKTDHYDSNNFSLGLDYPHGWTLTDTAGSGKLTIASPAMQLKATNGQTVSGQIIMTIRDKTQKLFEFDKGAALAVRDSEKIAYTQPSQIQRGSTYLSFLQYATTAGSGFDAIYITGDNGYQKGQTIPAGDISKSDPVISIGFTKCVDSKCASATPLSLDTAVWDDSGFSKPLKSLLESLTINR